MKLSEYTTRQTARAEMIRQHLLESAEIMRRVSMDLADQTARAAAMLADALLAGHKVLVCGNGGSAADAQHFVGELIGRFKLPQRAALPAIALNADGAVLTCVANDFSYEEVFSRQVEALAQPGDVLVSISTSGRSPNILRAMSAARERGAHTLVLFGAEGGFAANDADLALLVPSSETTLIQECHITLIHAICEIIELEVTSS